MDRIVRATAYEGRVRVFAACTTKTVDTVRAQHDMTPTVIAAVGRTLTATAILGTMLKNDETVMVQVKGDGPIGYILMLADALGRVRGYAQQPQVDLPLNAQGKLDVGGAVGKGMLYVTKDVQQKEPYRGSVPLVSGEIAEDFTAYFAQSEQTPTAVALGVLVGTHDTVAHSGGLIVQLMPGATEDIALDVEQRVQQLLPMTTLMQQGYELEEIIAQVVPHPRIGGQYPVQLHCVCDAQRIERTMRALGSGQLTEIVAEGQGAELVCHFCNQKHKIEHDTLKTWLAQMNAGVDNR